MKKYLSFIRSKFPQTPGSSELIRSLFSKFQMILDMNTKLLEKMAELERMSGGEYIFDKAFLDNSVSEVSSMVYQVVYSLNAMTENRFSELFDTFQSLKGCLEDILAGGLGPYANSRTLPYSAIRMEMAPLAGSFSASLAELSHHMDLHTPDGFAVTSTCIAQFLEDNDLHSRIEEFAARPWSEDSRSLITETIRNAGFRSDTTQAVTEEARRLSERIGKNTLLSIVSGIVKKDGTEDYARIDRVSPTRILEGFKKSIADCLIKVIESHQAIQQTDLFLSVSIHAMIHPRLSGIVSTLDAPSIPKQLARVTVDAYDDSSGITPDRKRSESYLVYRFYPYEPVQSEITTKNPGQVLPDNKKSLSMTRQGLRRGSSMIRRKKLISLIESAMAVERTFGRPHNVRWSEEAGSGRMVITGIDPLSIVSDEDTSMEQLNEQLNKATLIMSQGETVQMGVATGRVVHVTEGSDFTTFPMGGIAVARKASPHLSPVLRRASGLITETGSPAGHLAAIARETRLPSIMGASQAMNFLKEGMVITMDAGESKVYKGVLELLIRYRSSGVELYPTDPEYIMLRHLNRWIIPLNLTDPESADFTSGNCRTFHDIVHFAHEMAVEELLNIQSRHKKLKGVATRRLLIDVPLDIRVLDIGGRHYGPEMKVLEIQDLQSLPFKAFIRGVTMEDMWDQRPSSIGLREIFSGMDRTYAALTNQPGYSGQNLAIVAENYLNLTLRLGYHFNVINAYLSENQNKNFIYYRFVGGFAYEDRRRRRAEFIAAILENMDFRISIQGDLVIGKLKIADSAHMESALVCLGELTGFTRQLDIRMGFENDVEKFIELFHQRTRGDVSDRKGKDAV